MISFKTFPGVVALSVMLASTLAAAAPTPSSEKASFTQSGDDSFEEIKSQADAQADADTHAEANAEVDFQKRAKEQVATENLDFNVSGADINRFINSLSSQVVGRVEEDKNAEDSSLASGLIGGPAGGFLGDFFGPGGPVRECFGINREDVDLPLMGPRYVELKQTKKKLTGS